MSEKLYVINSTKRIKCLHNITGPITKPVELDPLDVLDMVKSGFEIYEVNPYDKKERVKVTPFNYNTITFKTTQYDMLQRKRLNRELQTMDKNSNTVVKEEKKVDLKKEEKKDEPKKDDKKESDKKVVENNSNAEKPTHTDFQKN